MSGSLPPPHKTISPIRCSEKPWDLWVSEIGHSSPLRDEEPPVAPAEAAKGTPGCRPAPSTSNKHPPHTGVTRLKLSSMCLYGQFPNTDNLNAAVCYMCGMTMKCSAAHRHLVEYHSSSVDPILPPPPPAPTVKLKSSHSKSKYKKEVPPPSIGQVEELLPPAPDPPPEAELQPALVPIAPRIVLSQDLTYFPELEVTGQKCTPSTQSEVKVSVDDNDLPVVSIQDNTDLPLADDIIEIMNSEGIQSIEEADTAAWKNLMQDFGAIQDMTLQNTTLLVDVSSHGLYDANRIPARMAGTTFTLAGDDGTLQYTQPITLTPTLTVDNQCVTFPNHPVQCAPTKPKPKPAKSSSKTTKFASREYDPNKHCGVTTGESQKPCTRSLTCKAHTLSLRRLVDGRIKSFDVLLAEHRAAKQASLVSPPPLIVNQVTTLHQPSLVNHPTLPNTVNVTSQVSLVNQSNLISPVAVVCSQNNAEPVGMSPPLVIPGQVDISAFGGFPSPEAEVADYYTSVVGEGLVEEVPAPVPYPAVVVPAPVAAPPRLPEPRPGDVCWYPSSPRPLAACTFSAYHMGNALLLGKRMATIRSNVKATLMQPHSKNVSGYYNFSHNSMSKTMHVNNAAKPAVPEVRKLIMSCPAVSGSSIKTDPGLYYNSGSRHNGHLFSSKRPCLDDYEDMESKCLRTAGSSVTMRSKVSKHLNQSDMMELNLMFDPLMADEKC